MASHTSAEEEGFVDCVVDTPQKEEPAAAAPQPEELWATTDAAQDQPEGLADGTGSAASDDQPNSLSGDGACSDGFETLGAVRQNPHRPGRREREQIRAERATKATALVGRGHVREATSCLDRQLQKTKFCCYHLHGNCHYGEKCTFAHSTTEMHVAPDLHKTKICEAFMAGKCEQQGCTYAHGEQELRVTGIFYKKTLCIWYEQRKCRNGDSCRFAHGVVELRGLQPATSQAAGATKPLELVSLGAVPPPPGLERDREQAELATELSCQGAALGALSRSVEMSRRVAAGGDNSKGLQASIQEMERNIANLSAQFGRLERQLAKEKDLPTPTTCAPGKTPLRSPAKPFIPMAKQVSPQWLTAPQW